MRSVVIAALKLFWQIATRLFQLIPADKKYFIFSSKYGFSDNSKYLFLYYVKQKRQCIWVASDDECYVNLQREYTDSPYVTIVKKNSPQLLIALTRAKYVFVTHSLLDLGALVKKCCPVVNLWHGIPFKKMGYDSKSDIKLFNLNTKNPYTDNDYIIASAEVTRPFAISCMNLPTFSVLGLGQPRNDFLATNKSNEKLTSKLKSIYSTNKDIKVFLYAPTFRDKEHTSLKIYKKLINSFITYSKETDLLVLRLHPKEKELISGMPLPSNIKLSQITDVQEELLAADTLISDFSSITFDYALLDKPIFLFVPDKSEYIINRGGSYFEFDDIFSSCIEVTNEELTNIWSNDVKRTEHQKIKSLHSLNASESIYKHFQ